MKLDAVEIFSLVMWALSGLALFLTSNLALAYYDRVGVRYKEVKMLHIGFGSGWWYPLDVWFVITGRV